MVIEARGVRHTIGVTFDEKLGKPIITRRTKQIPHVPGTLVRLLWPDIADSLEPDETEEGTWAGEAIGGMRGACDFLAAYAVFNPHLSINGHGPAWEVDRPALDPKWPKWRPDEATSPFWYTAEQLGRLVAGEYRASPDAPKSIRPFIAQFRGLSGSFKQKAICTAAGIAPGETVADLFGKNNQVDPARITRLLAAMQAESKPLKPDHLGMIGRDHMKRGLCDLFDVSQWSVRYERATGTTDDGVPWVLEVAFGVSTKDDDQRNILAGVNWSPSLRQPFDDLNDVLAENFIESDDPVVVAVHLIHPDPTSTDRGKTRYILDSEIRERLVSLVAKAAAVWRKMKAKAQREERRLSREQLVEQREGKRSEKQFIIDSAYKVIPAAYADASGSRGLAHARQVMYSARPLIDAAGGRLWKKDKYFTQVLLPNFVAANPELTQDWDVIYDERGHFAEPHTKEMFGIGTLTVRKYTRGWTKSIDDSFEKAPVLSTAITTHGPANRFKFALFVEKQGFNPLIERARIAERFDIAIFSTKGMSTTAARQLVEDLSAMGVTILVLHDFDKSGLGILHTLRNDTRRFHFKTPPKVIDLGITDRRPRHGSGIRDREIRGEGQPSSHTSAIRRDRRRDRIPRSGAERGEAVGGPPSRTERHELGRLGRVRRATIDRRGCDQTDSGVGDPSSRVCPYCEDRAC